MTYDLYTDKQLVDGLIQNDKPTIEYFFCKKCSRLFSYIVYSVYGGMATLNELVNEFYLYIAADNWKKVRQFDFRSKLMTWIGVVAIAVLTFIGFVLLLCGEDEYYGKIGGQWYKMNYAYFSEHRMEITDDFVVTPLDRILE